MITINGKDYKPSLVKAAGMFLLPAGIIVAIISFFVAFVMPFAGSCFMSIGFVLVYVSTVYINALKDGYGNIDFKKILTVVLLTLFPVIGIIFMFVGKTVTSNAKKVIIVILAVLWLLFSTLLYSTASSSNDNNSNASVSGTEVTTTIEPSTKAAETTSKTSNADKTGANKTEADNDVTTSSKTTTKSNATKETKSVSKSTTATKANSNKEFPTAEVTATTSGNNIKYVLNTSDDRKKIHYPSCRDVPNIAAENYLEYSGDLEVYFSQGYTPCGHCHAGQ